MSDFNELYVKYLAAKAAMEADDSDDFDDYMDARDAWLLCEASTTRELAMQIIVADECEIMGLLEDKLHALAA